MKKQIARLLAVAGLAFGAASVQANFTVNFSSFNNNPAFGVVWLDTVGTMSYDQNTFLPINVTGGALPGSTVVKADFVFSAGGNTAVSQVFTLDQYGTLADQARTITSTIEGGTAGTYQMRAWVGGNSFSDVNNTRTGVSLATAINLGGGIGNAPVTDVSSFANFAVVAVPEPATLALGLFGVAGLLVRRRK